MLMLCSVFQIAPLMDKRVEIHDTARADINGMHGVATDFHPIGGLRDRTKDRYTVQLETGEEVQVSCQALVNIRLRTAHTLRESEGVRLPSSVILTCA